MIREFPMRSTVAACLAFALVSPGAGLDDPPKRTREQIREEAQSIVDTISAG